MMSREVAVSLSDEEIKALNIIQNMKQFPSRSYTIKIAVQEFITKYSNDIMDGARK